MIVAPSHATVAECWLQGELEQQNPAAATIQSCHVMDGGLKSRAEPTLMMHITQQFFIMPFHSRQMCFCSTLMMRLFQQVFHKQMQGGV